jgi:hypothetical protein
MMQTKESIESADKVGAPRWIRFEHYTRYHAIYASHWGVYWTYCGARYGPKESAMERASPGTVRMLSVTG